MWANVLRNWWVVLLLIIVVIGLVIANRTFLTANNVYADRDFMSLWSGGKAVIEGLNPYSEDVWLPLRAQYGSEWRSDEKDPFPLWTAIAFAPLATLSVENASAVWLALSEMLLFVTLVLLIRLSVDRRLSLAELGLIVLGVFTSRWTASSLLTGQISIMMAFMLTVFLVLLKADRPFEAGLALTLIGLKPNPFLLFAPAICLWLVINRRWAVIIGGIVGTLVLFIMSWIALPGWVFDWLDVRGKLSVTHRTPTVWGIGYELGGPGWWAFIGLVLGILTTVVLGTVALTNHSLTENDVVALTITGSILITPYAWIYEHALLIIPATLLYGRLHSHRVTSLAVYLFVVLISPWTVYIYAKSRNSDTISVVVPILVLTIYMVSISMPPDSRTEAQQTASPTPA